MKEFKKKFPDSIYELSYENLVRYPNKEIKSLIKWIGWNWEEKFLKPERNKRIIQTASSSQARAPIYSTSIDNWRNYIEILKPAIEIINEREKHEEEFLNILLT